MAAQPRLLEMQRLARARGALAPTAAGKSSLLPDVARLAAATAAQPTVARSILAASPAAARFQSSASRPKQARSKASASAPNGAPKGRANGFPSFDELVSGSISSADVPPHIYRLPMFQHSSRGPARLSRTDTSRTCEGVLRSGGWKIFDLLRTGFMSFELARFVRCEMMGDGLHTCDFLVGAREAFLLQVDLFNTFHLEASRTQLRTICRPPVFAALESSWKMLDEAGLRMQWRVIVADMTVRQYMIHDSDAIDDEPGGGGGVAVPITPDVPPSATGGSGRGVGGPGDSATDKIKGSGSKSSGGSSNSSSAPKRKNPRALEPVRYVDLDIQYHVVESFELFTTRADQIVPPTEYEIAMEKAAAVEKEALEAKQKKKAAAKAAAAAAATPATPAAATTPAATPAAPVDPLNSASVDHASVLSEMNRLVVETESAAAEPTKLEPEPTEAATETDTPASTTTAATPAAVSPATPAATAATSSTATPSPSTSTATTAAATPKRPAPPADYLPPLQLLYRVDDITERGLRFWSSLPEPREPGDQPWWYSSNPQFASFSNPRIDKAPIANWIIKDILD